MNLDIRTEEDPLKRAILACWLVHHQATTLQSIDGMHEVGRAMEITASMIGEAIAGWEFTSQPHRVMFDGLRVRYRDPDSDGEERDPHDS